MTSLTVAEIADRVGGRLEGDPESVITGLAAVEDAGPGDLTVVLTRARADSMDESSAAAALVPLDLRVPATTVSLVRVENPRLALATITPLLAPEPTPEPGVASTADVHPDAVLGRDVSIGSYAVIGARAVVGEDTWIGPHTFVAPDAVIGASCRIEASCTIGSSVQVGDRVRLQSGVRLGTDGFGYTQGPDGPVKIPQIGRCLIGNDVDIGANATVDRGALGDTVIGAGTKIDNQVEIAHNVRIGRNCLIAGHSGVAGSAELGDGVVIGGGVGISDHIKIGDGARVGARSGVGEDIPAGGQYFGYPARPHRQAMRAAIAMLKLPELIKRVRKLEAAAQDENE